MAIFGRMTARQRLRRATRESLSIPAFSPPIDCTPWVIGGLWPAELSTITGENAALADYLRADLRRIADSANEQLKIVKRAGLAELPRQAEETRVIDEARARAVRRVESTIRQLRASNAGVTVGHPRPHFAEPPSPGMDQTQVIPSVTDAEPSNAPTRTVRKPRWRIADKPAPVVPQGGGDDAEPPPDEPTTQEETQVIPPVVDAEPAADGRHHVEAQEPAPVPDETRPAQEHAPDAAVAALEETQVMPAISAAVPAIDEPAGSAEPAMDQAAPGWAAEPVDDTTVGLTEETQVMPAIAEAVPVMDEPAGSAEPVADGRHHMEAQEPAMDQAAPGWAAEPVDDTAVGLTEKTQVMPAIAGDVPVMDEPAGSAEPVGNGRHHVEAPEAAPVPDESRRAQQPPPADDAEVASLDETQIIPAITEALPVADEPADSGRHHAVVGEPVASRDEPQPRPEPPHPASEKSMAATGFDVERLNRLLEFVVRQEPRLNWAVGDRADGTTVLVTDLAHGWIPAGITLPAGVRLLEPEQRSGRVTALIGDAVRVVTYAPGDSLRRSVDFAATKSSLEPRELPAIEDLGNVLSATTRRFDGLPRIVQRLADAAAADAVIIDQEVDVLRVHLDTARYQLLVQYPAVNPALLLKCLLMAATEGIASGDPVSANYHLAWYQKLASPPPGT
ncbi:hypothetical protein A5692_25190 [Mycobacterium sp. E342]|uniref:DUF5631 domain-containing protein n=1 Tax=Mycobacterium sp. E342 TaxID=1834147 RepID=UPI0007FF452C|nr:DUF5631 domain-containing protein [Mycobacterium sp. E342]OBH27303.1 hypothetical protein A5692_25190 [Mycobacterium sp. E342]